MQTSTSLTFFTAIFVALGGTLAEELMICCRHVIKNWISTTNLAACVCVCVCAKFDQFLPVRSHFDTKRPVNFFHIATFPSPTFGPLFAFHCPLFFTKNNNLECRDVLKTVTVTSDQKRFGPYTAHN